MVPQSYQLWGGGKHLSMKVLPPSPHRPYCSNDFHYRMKVAIYQAL